MFSSSWSLKRDGGDGDGKTEERWFHRITHTRARACRWVSKSSVHRSDAVHVSFMSCQRPQHKVPWHLGPSWGLGGGVVGQSGALANSLHNGLAVLQVAQKCHDPGDRCRLYSFPEDLLEKNNHRCPICRRLVHCHFRVTCQYSTLSSENDMLQYIGIILLSSSFWSTSSLATRNYWRLSLSIEFVLTAWRPSSFFISLLVH